VRFTEIDEAGHRAKVAAQGSDAKGRGAANAVAVFHLEPANGGSRVLVHTNLTLSGAVAQHGRGVGIIQLTAAQIITQFANNLKAQLAQAAVPAPPLAGEGEDSGGVRSPSTPGEGKSAAKPISAFALIGNVLWQAIRRLFGRA
jgi:hypothetical protein